MGFKVEAFMTIKTTGGSGTLDAHIGVYMNSAWGDSDITVPANDAIDTTVTRTLEMRCRFSTNAATNTLTVRQGFYEKVK
jgi:hypothetical protein